MSQIHFITLTAALFTNSYIGVAWVMAGAPLPIVPFAQQETRAAALPPIGPAPTVQQRPVQQAALARPIPQPALPPGDGHPQRDELRRAALQASTAYVQTPCDEVAKAMLIGAVSAYAKAWADMMGCGPDGCDYRKINATAAVFSTPLDIEVRDAVGAAFDKRGISIDDFPSSLRINVAMLVRGRGAPSTACPETRAQVWR
jgi:hypothetical protein